MNRSSRFNPLHLLSFLLISLVVLLLPPGVFAAGLLAGGGTHSLAISPGNAFGYAWGANRDGQMGNEGTGRNQPYPSRWSPFAAASSSVGVQAADEAPVQVASGDRHSLALRSDGTVWAWGLNGSGQLGDGTTTSRLVPIQVPGLREVVAIAAGKTHSLAVTQDGTVWAWGNNSYRQLGNNSADESHVPTPVVTVVERSDGGLDFPPLTDVVTVAASEVHSVALKRDGTVWAWGDNQYGQLGNERAFGGSATAKPVAGLTGVHAIIAGGFASTHVELGTAYTLAQTEDGTFYGWGNNSRCQLGEAAWEKQTTPVSLPNLNRLGNVDALAGGGAHGVALTADGQVWTWGDNGHGQLGDGTSTDRCAPQAVTGVTGAETISAGVAHTLVTQRDGTVWAWGQNDTGQLGDGTADDNGTPKPVKGLCRVGALNVKTPPPAGCPVTVEIDSAGDGGGTVSGGGEYAAGATITLTATPDANSQFVGWQPEPCAASFTMPAQALTCRATFTRRETVSYPLTVTVNPASTGSGTVSGGGTYPAGATVTLTATPDGFDTFTGWTPTPCAASFTLPAQVLTCTATFGPPVIGLVTLRTAGDGAGTVNGGGEYFVGETVSLRAQPNVTSDFVNWSPAPCATAFTLSSGDDLTCIATFASRLRHLEIRLAGDGRGAVSNSAGDYEPGATITLTATPAAGSQFVGWSPAPCAAEFTMPEDDLTCTATFTAGGPAAALVQHYYQAILGRAADDDGAAYWQGEVARAIELGIDPQEALRVMAGQFFASAEYQNRQPNDTQFVTDLYRTFFNREPDDDGLSYWLGQIIAGLPRNIVLYQFLFSSEFTAYMQEQFGPTTSRAEVATIVDFYRGLLGRLPDNDGFAYWLERFRTAQCQGAAAINATVEAISSQFVHLPEYQNRQRTDREYLQDLYGAFLRRGADLAGFDYWQEQLAQGGQTREQVRQAFIATPEFQGRVQQVIEQGCWNPNVTKFIQISASSAHTCGIQMDGVVKCWGYNDDGRATPPDGTFTQVSAGLSHTCGVKTDGMVTCWGNDQATPPDGTFTQVSTGWNYACGVQTDGTVACWGDNRDGQATPPAGTFTQVSAGDNHTCGVRTDGTVACWGDNISNQATPPVGTFTQVSAGSWYTCGVQTDGTVACWGSNWGGRATPPEGTFTQVSAGDNHTCGVRTDGIVACWGGNGAGRATPPMGIYYPPLQVAMTGRGAVHSDPAGIACETRCYASYALYTVVTLTATPADDTRFVRWEGNCQGVAPTCTVTMSQTRTVTAIFATASDSPYTQVSAGMRHTCGVQTDGAVACWGDNISNQATPPAGTFTQVSAGSNHTCGVQTDGTVTCWGYNYSGKATPPAGTFTQVSTGVQHTCGIRTDGTVACWGDNRADKATPPDGTFTQVSAGWHHTCGMQIDGAVACWGDNRDGQATPPVGTFTQVSAGSWHTCGVQTDGTVACWGSNTDYDGNFVGQATPPVGNFTQISAGGWHTCGVQTDGAVACWGDNEDGQATPPDGTFTQVSAGEYHTCGVQTDGAVACWGSNTDDFDNFIGQATPPDGINYRFLQVTVAGHGMVQSTATGIACGTDCGENYWPDTEVTLLAQPAEGSRFSRWDGACSGSVPTCTLTMSETQTVQAIFISPSTRTFTQVSAGGAHTCGVQTDSTVVCWGSNTDDFDDFVGQATPPDGTFTQVSAGLSHTCGVQTDGTVACWGDIWYALLGTFTQVSTGGTHTCGVQTHGTVVCWGDDDYDQATPPASMFIQVSAGLFHTCGVKTDGTVTCWGDNRVGQATPMDGTFTQVSAGDYHTCGIKTDGTVACWGWNGYGQAMRPAGAFIQVSAGGSHTCGVQNDGFVVCWGSDDYGQSTPP